MPSLRSLRQIGKRFLFSRDPASILERVKNVLEKEKVSKYLYDREVLMKVCEFYRFDLRAVLNYIQILLRKKKLRKEHFLSELKHDLGEQTSYFDLMDRLCVRKSTKSIGFYRKPILRFREVNLNLGNSFYVNEQLEKRKSQAKARKGGCFVPIQRKQNTMTLWQKRSSRRKE